MALKYFFLPIVPDVVSSWPLNDNSNEWFNYREAGRIHVYQDDDEIWYLMPNGSTKNFSGMNFGTESSPVYAANNGNTIYQTSYVLEPLRGGDSFALGDNTCVTMQLFNGIVTTIPDGAFDETDKEVHCTNVWLPSYVSKIGNNAFKNCSNLLQFPKHTGLQSPLTSIGAYAFFGCSSMVAASINAYNVTSLGEYAFGNCHGVESITLGGGNIPSYAFTGCTNLKSVLFSSTTKVKSIGGSAFANCSSLTKVASSNYTYDRVNLTQVTSVAYAAFRNCSSLEVAILSSAKSLGNLAFSDCTNLKSVTLLGVETI